MIRQKHILSAIGVVSYLLGGSTAQAMIMSGLHKTSSLYTQYIAETLAKQAIPGAIVGIWQPGRPTYLRAFGKADIAQNVDMTTRMLLPTGNVSTSYVVRAALLLAKAHKISLAAPVSDYLSNVPEGQQISVADLAQMRSGLFDYRDNPAFVKQIVAHPQTFLSPEDLLNYSFEHPLLFKPGTRFQYSYTNTLLLGLIIEKVTGQSLAKVIQEQIAQPYKLRRTIFSDSTVNPVLEVRGYTINHLNKKMIPVIWNPSWFWAAGAVTATAADLQRWARINADLAVFSSTTVQQEMTKDSVRKDASTGYSWGSYENGAWVGNASQMAGFESVVIYSPQYKDTIVIFLNAEAMENGIPVASLMAQRISRYITQSSSSAYMPPTTGVRH